MEYPSFEQFAEVIRGYAALKRNRHLGPETELQRDLGMNEGEGSALLKFLQTHYGVALSPDSFDLKAHQRLFHPKETAEEPSIQTVFGTAQFEVRPLTLGLLCRAVLKEMSKTTAP